MNANTNCRMLIWHACVLIDGFPNHLGGSLQSSDLLFNFGTTPYTKHENTRITCKHLDSYRLLQGPWAIDRDAVRSFYSVFCHFDDFRKFDGLQGSPKDHPDRFSSSSTPIDFTSSDFTTSDDSAANSALNLQFDTFPGYSIKSCTCPNNCIDNSSRIISTITLVMLSFGSIGVSVIFNMGRRK